MEKQVWTTIDLLDVVGMASNPIKPGSKYAKRLLNVTPNERTGALTIRKGYASKYDPPTNPLITNSKFIDFQTFTDKQINIDGQEIFLLIQKGIMGSLKNTNDQPIVPDYGVKGFWFWIRPYWDGQQFVDEWELLNEVIITKILEKDSTYPNRFKIFGNPDTHNITQFKLCGWHVYNYTKSWFAQIVVHKNAGEDVYINISKSNTNWDVDDVLILCKSYIDLSIMGELYNNVKMEDIVYHKINSDLRIGFGGYKNRDGLIVGYRKNYLLLTEILGNQHPDMSEYYALEKYKTVNRFIVEPIFYIRNTARLNFNVISGSMPQNEYYFKTTYVIDGYEEILDFDTSINLDGTKTLEITPYLETLYPSTRITNIKTYFSEDGVTYNLLRADSIRANSPVNAGSLTLNTSGHLMSKKLQLQTLSPAINYGDNCTSTFTETNSTAGWRFQLNPQYLKLYSVSSFKFDGVNDKYATHGLWFLLISNQWMDRLFNGEKITLISPEITKIKAFVKIEFKIYTRGYHNISISSEAIVPNPFGDPPQKETIEIFPTEEWYPIALNMEIEGCITMEFHEPVTNAIGIDELKVTYLNMPDINQVIIGNEMSNEMGYNPTYNLVRAWDDIVINKGRVYYLNPYIDRRYLNFLFVSIITGKGIFMWDIATAQNFRELDKNDGNKAIGIETLPNGEIIILKDSSIVNLYDDGYAGVLREPIYGIDCISKKSIVNINGILYWCGKDEVYILNISNGMIPLKTLKDTIRNLYLSIENKHEIFGSVNRYNTYRIRINKPNEKIEYILTETGWVEERKYHFAEVYRYGNNNKMYFLSNGKIYEEYLKYEREITTYGQQQSDQ